MNDSMLIVADLIAVFTLALALYFPRYHRRDMVLAIISINVGVLAVALVLSRADVTAGLGFGLFGVLSIIRLRSQELDQEEVAYYFSAIALGLLGGVRVTPDWIALALMAAIVFSLFVVDHPRLFPLYRNQMVTLDSALTDEAELHARLGELLGGQVVKMKVKRVDLVNDTTVVDVRYKLAPQPIVR
jgi:hypothetical protein